MIFFLLMTFLIFPSFEEKDFLSVSSSHEETHNENENDDNNSNGVSLKEEFGSVPDNELSVPTNDVEQLEWFSHFVEDSFTVYSLLPYPEENPLGFISSARTQLDLLEQLTSTSSYTDGSCNEGESAGRPTIRYQLLQLVGDREGEDFSIPLGKDLKKVSKRFLTVSQKRNIKRQTYLNDVSKRNDTVFFSTIAAFVILPPILILMVAVITGNVQLLP